MKRLLIPLLLLPFSFGCQTTSPPLSPPEPETPLQRFGRVQQQAGTLPGATVTSTSGSLIISYPQESLFSAGSVLPLAGGAEALDPLADLLDALPEGIWEATVQAATSNGADYDSTLARRRSELLQRYLHNRGIPGERVTWQTKGGDGPPLELTLRPLQPADKSSPTVKE